MQNYIVYETATGKIESVLRLSPLSKHRMDSKNAHITLLEGSVPDVNRYQMNVSVTPHVVELKPAPTINIEEYVRQNRTKLLQISDWTQTADSPLSDSKKAEWATYRQSLRDMPANSSSWSTVEDITWPSKPN